MIMMDIPTGKVSQRRKEVKADLKRRIIRYAGDGKNVNVVVMGDFNMNLQSNPKTS